MKTREEIIQEDANMELKEAVNNVAIMTRAYYCALIEAGFSQDHAERFTAVWVRALVQKPSEPQADPFLRFDMKPS
jgi:hypothetical protein